MLSDEFRNRISEALKPMHREFVERDSSFARRIMNEGARLL